MVEEVVSLLEASLPKIRTALSESTTFFFTVDVAGCHQSGSAFQPFCLDAVRMWKILATAPHIVDRMKVWFGEVENLITYADSTGSFGSLWEIDEVQFGEAAASSFAILSRQFVPSYSRLLQVWDMDHEVAQFDVINEIVTAHGVCPETEGLLRIRATKAIGQTGHDQFNHLMPLLEQHYGDFNMTELHKLLKWD